MSTICTGYPKPPKPPVEFWEVAFKCRGFTSAQEAAIGHIMLQKVRGA